jgi:hypothetical protein
MGGPHLHFRYGRLIRQELDGQKEVPISVVRESKKGISQTEVPFLA